MTVQISHGNLLDQQVDAIVNTVNTVGVMGKGIALQFKRKWPENFKAYEKAVGRGDVRIGRMFVFDNGGLATPHFIINFPTKEHWRSDSQIEFIRAGLADLVATIKSLNIKSIAIPPLGCGNGGLDWSEVRPIIEDVLSAVPNLEVRLFEPSREATLHELAAESKQPRMTPGRAAIVTVTHAYQRMMYRLSMLEVQKLAYFLSEAGEPLQLEYAKAKFGPYSRKLKHVLLKMDGAYVTGVGDLNAPSAIEVLPGALENAVKFFDKSNNSQTRARVKRVVDLIEGYETPYGLELLSTVHWAAKEKPATTEIDDVALRVGTWNARKKQIMPRSEIEGALERLTHQGWLN